MSAVQAMWRLRLAAVLALALRACGATTAPFIPLSAATWNGGTRLGVSVSLVAPDGSALPAQQLALATGSSTLAFCKHALGQQAAQETVSVNETKVVSCSMYDDDGTTDSYWGYLYKGPVQVGGQGQPHSLLKSTYYTVMQAQMGMPCDENFQGFFGIGFHYVDGAYAYGDSLQRWAAEGVNSSCPTSALESAFDPPVWDFVREDPSADMLLGLYWSGQEGPEAGELYVQSAAYANPRATEGKPVDQVNLGDGWYSIYLFQIALSAASGAGPWTTTKCLEELGGACTIDLGSPGLVVPKPVMAAIEGLQKSRRPLGNITFSMFGVMGIGTVELAFDVATLLERGWIYAGEGDEVTLGLPLLAFYYTVFSLEGGSAVFISHAGGVAAPQPSPSAALGDSARRLRGASGTSV